MAKILRLRPGRRSAERIIRVRGKFLFPFVFICAGLSLFWGGDSCGAQTSPTFPTSLEAVDEGEKKEKKTGEKIWQTHRDLLRKGEWEKSQSELEKLYQWKLNQGICNHYHYAAALVRESQEEAQEGITAAIPALLNYAEKMAPDFAQVTYARVRWLWSQDFPSLTNISKAIWLWVRGFFLSFYNLEEALPQLANLLLWILSSFLLTLAIFSFMLFSKYHSFISHHLKHLIRAKESGKALGALSLLLFLTPLLLGGGWMWLLVLWLLVFWIYGNRADRAVTMAFLVALLLLPTGVRIYSAFLVSLTGNGILDIARANTGVFNEELRQKLLTMQKKNPQDPDILQAIGLIEKRMGKFKEAEHHFLQWAQLEPRASAAFNNLGNIYLASNRTDKAVEAYQKAIQLEPAKTESYYNLGQAYLLNLLLNEAESEFRRARELRPQLTSFYTSISSRNPNRMAIDQTIELSRLWKRVFAETPEREKVAGAFWQILWGRVPLKFGEEAAAGLLALLLIVQFATRGKVLIRNCEKCGRLICSRCTRSMVIGNQCSQCVNAFTARTSSDPQVVKQKRAEAARYQDRKKSFVRWFSLFLPGGGHLWRNDSQEGIVYLFIFILFLMKIIFWRGWIPTPVVLDISFDFLWMIITAALFLFYYGLVQYRIRLRSRERKFSFGTT